MEGIQKFAFLPHRIMLVLRIYGPQAIQSRVTLGRAGNFQHES